MMMIPIAKPDIGKEELDNVTKAVKSGWISSKGEFIEKFENGFSKYCNSKYGVATSNGTTALHLALTALGIKENDEVIIPTLTFIATANAVSYCGAQPIMVDSHPDYWCIDPDGIEEKITERTKAIIPVHLYGHPCDMDKICKIAKSHNLFIIEDAAEAHGAKYKGKQVGALGDISCFSFYGNKIISTGEGGMCVTDKTKYAEKMKILRDHGMNPKKRYWHDQIGFNYRMTNLQAAIGVAQLNRIDNLISRKRDIAKQYQEHLKDTNWLTLHPEEKWAKNVFWMYSALIKQNGIKMKKSLMQYLAKSGIETRPFFNPIHKMPPHFSNNTFKVAEFLSSSGINFPSATSITSDEIKFVCEKIKSFHSNKN